MKKNFDIAIIGGGASGLAAAIKAKETAPAAEVALIEKMNEPAKKLSASGNGRGNLSNRKCDSCAEVLEFFSQVGIAVRMDDEGRIYPYSEEAKSVAVSLAKKAERLGVEMILNTEVSDVEADRDKDGGFRIFVCDGKDEARGWQLRAGLVLIATGGKSFAAYGSTGDGQKMARKAGHTVTPLIPALTAIEVKEDIKRLKGVRAKARVSLFKSGDMLFCEDGEIQFREDSISGICVMNMSSLLPVSERGQLSNPMEECRITVNFVPDLETPRLLGFLKAEAAGAGASAEDMLATLVKKPLIREILFRTGIEPSAAGAGLTMTDIMEIANGLRTFELSPQGRKGWKEAQVTKGGVALEEIDMNTMESKLIPGLYFAGEVTDYDGPCGGYNLNYAWITGIKAGKAMAEQVCRRAGDRAKD